MDINQTLAWASKHSLFIDKAHWSVAGYFQKDGLKTLLKGCLQVSPNDSRCQLTTDLYDAANGLLLLQRHSKLSGFKQASNIWHDDVGSYGNLSGRFSIIDETLLVNLVDKQNNYQSFESLLKVFEEEYELRGVLYQGTKRIMVWRLELVKLAVPC